MQRVSKKYNSEKAENFAAYGQFTYDVQGGDDLTNKKIAQELLKLNLLSKNNFDPITIRFLEKVDVNGKEMCDLYKFLKRQSPGLFNKKFGMAARINEHYTKFLCNRYGEVKHMY